MNILDLIEDAIRDISELENKIPKEIAVIKPFEKNDFDYIFKYLEYFNNDMDFRKFMTYCNKLIWDEISCYSHRKSIWYWENDENTDFIKNQILRIKDLLDSFIILIKHSKYFDAFILFRSFIEISSQLYACLLDYDFYKKYTNSEVDEEYQKHWFKNLKPEKVISTLRRLNGELRTEYKKTGQMVVGDLRGFIFPFESELRNKLYNEFSNMGHGKYNNIISIPQSQIDKYLHMTTEYLVMSTSLLNIALNHYITNDNKVDKRKHQIILSVWIKANYYNNGAQQQI